MNNEIKNSQNTVKTIMKEKLGEFISLDIDKIQISEFNTRCQFIDDGHVETLMSSIEKNGYIPKAAVWINAVKGPEGKILSYRLVAGRHRYEACRRLGLREIPTQLYYNLTDEEECELDTMDNELDEHHKPVNFLAIAEHYKYLRDVKGWSQRQIAEAKNVSRAVVQYRLKISEFSEEIKQFFRGGQHAVHFVERNVVEISRLSSIPYQIKVCEEIILKNKVVTQEDGGSCRFQSELTTTEPIKYEFVRNRVEELLKIEQQEKMEQQILETVEDNSRTLSSVSNSAHKKIRSQEVFLTDSKLEGKKEISGNCSQAVSNNPEKISSETQDKAAKSSPSQKKKKSRDIPGQLIWEIFFEMADMRTTMTKPREFRFSVLPMWVKHTNLVNDMWSSAYLLLQELISYDFRYRPEKDSFFFIKHGKSYENCLEFLAHIAGVTVKTLEKKILPALQKYVVYKKNGGSIRFQLRWDNLFEAYKEKALNIPFDDGGLQDIPEDYTGWIRPTPYHSLYIENGLLKPLKEVLPETIKEEDLPLEKSCREEKISSKTVESKPVEIKKEEKPPVKESPLPDSGSEDSVKENTVNSATYKKLRELKMGESQIRFCLERRDITENIFKYLSEMAPAEKDKIKNMAGYVYKMVRDGFEPPEGFISNGEVREKMERKKVREEFGEKIRKAFEEGTIKYFVPEECKRFHLTIVPDCQNFVYRKSLNGLPVSGRFDEWFDEKYFSV